MRGNRERWEVDRSRETCEEKAAIWADAETSGETGGKT